MGVFRPRLILLATNNILDDSKTLADQKVENDAVVALALRKDNEFEEVSIADPSDFLDIACLSSGRPLLRVEAKSHPAPSSSSRSNQPASDPAGFGGFFAASGLKSGPRAPGSVPHNGVSPAQLGFSFSHPFQQILLLALDARRGGDSYPSTAHGELLLLTSMTTQYVTPLLCESRSTRNRPTQ
ncbi:hypothetical protein ZWY2020_009433 [Hordeum vulgare]|nr:hypothetical protein ZWY2020_009433 [Hordeum vulgare]